MNGYQSHNDHTDNFDLSGEGQSLSMKAEHMVQEGGISAAGQALDDARGWYSLSSLVAPAGMSSIGLVWGHLGTGQYPFDGGFNEVIHQTPIEAPIPPGFLQ